MKNLLFAGTALMCAFSSPVLALDPELADVNRIAFEASAHDRDR